MSIEMNYLALNVHSRRETIANSEQKACNSTGKVMDKSHNNS